MKHFLGTLKTESVLKANTNRISLDRETMVQEFKEIQRYKKVLSFYNKQDRQDPIIARLLERSREIIQINRKKLNYEIHKYYSYTREIRGQVFIGLGSTASRALEDCRKQIRQHRSSIKSKKIWTRSVYIGNNTYDNFYTVGGVASISGQILNFAEIKRVGDIFVDKKPLTEEEHVGIELEFFCKENKTALVKSFGKKGLTKYLTLKFDGSIKAPDGFNPFEVTACIPVSELDSVVQSISDVLTKECTSDVNRTCGFHVHLDMRNRRFSRDTIFHNLVTYQHLLYRMMPPSRKLGYKRTDGGVNHFAKPNPCKNFVKQRRTGSRYYAVNPHSLERHQTLEVRLHSGTIDARKILNFVKILRAIVEVQNKTLRAPVTVSGFARQVGLNSELKQYVQERINKFALDHAALDTSTQETESTIQATA